MKQIHKYLVLCSGTRELNRGPHDYESCALANGAIPPSFFKKTAKSGSLSTV